MNTAAQSRLLAAPATHRANSVIPGASRSIPAEICMWPIPEITACKNSCAGKIIQALDEFPIHSPALSLASAAGMGLGDLAFSQERRPNRRVEALDRPRSAVCSDLVRGPRHCWPAMAQAAG